MEGGLYALISVNLLWPKHIPKRRSSTDVDACLLRIALMLFRTKTAIPPQPLTLSRRNSLYPLDIELGVWESTIYLCFLNREDVENVAPKSFSYFFKLVW